MIKYEITRFKFDKKSGWDHLNKTGNAAKAEIKQFFFSFLENRKIKEKMAAYSSM